MTEMETRLTVDAGVCRFKTKIHAKGSDDYMSVDLVIESECPNVQELAAAIGTVDAGEVVCASILDNSVMKACSQFLPHPACPIPCAIVKACEVAGEQALKRTVTFTFE
jgi:hypothetical protein